jgi:RNA polymerase sigma-70 factor, ECF subfamily
MAIFERQPTAPLLRVVACADEAPASRVESDEALLLAFERGDRGVGARLYQYLIPVVDATLFRIFGRRDADHADLVQSVFEQLVMTLHKGRFAAKCSLVSWASVLACHVGLTALRSRRRRRNVIEPDADAEAANPRASESWNPERQMAAQRDLEVVRRHLSEMDEDRATALLLHAMGHSLKEIASLTHVSVAAAQSRLSRGRRELLARLQTEDAVEGAALPGRDT